MNQMKIGKFIAEMRKSQNLTQEELACKLGISHKTISKWECGNGMPEVSLMLPLCETLKINVNELFSGKRLSEADYKKKAEENIMKLHEEAWKKSKNIVGGNVLGEAVNIKRETEKIKRTNTNFWDGIGSECLGVTALPQWGDICQQRISCDYWEI